MFRRFSPLSLVVCVLLIVGSPGQSLAQPLACQVDGSGNRLPNQWCSGDVILGAGARKYVPLLDGNGQPVLDGNGNPIMHYVVPDGGKHILADATGVPLGPTIFDSGLGITSACSVNGATGDLWTAGLWSNLISHISAPAGSTAPQLLSPIDISSYVTTASCGSNPDAPYEGCGGAASLVFDRAGSLYVGTVGGTNQILKFSQAGVLLDTYTVPVGDRGAGWLDLAVDQQTMFYTSEDNTIRVFRLDRQPLSQALFDAGVEHLADPVLDPDSLGLFGKIVIRNAADEPINTRTYRVRVLPPGDGTGGLLVVLDAFVERLNLAGHLVQGFLQPDSSPLFSFDLTPDGKSLWMMTSANGPWTTSTRLVKYHIPTGTTEFDPRTGPGWQALAGLCVNGGYTAAVSQPDCSLDPTNSLCHSIPHCAAGEGAGSADCVSPGAPLLMLPPDQSHAEGDTIAPVAIVASDPHGNALTYAVDFLPRGLTFDAETKLISGTIDWLASDYLGLPATTVRVTVTNSRGLYTRKTFSWAVEARNAPPSATVSPSFPRNAAGAYLVSSPVGVPITVSLEGRDPDPCDGVVFYLYNGETLPDGLTLTPDDVSNPNCASNFVFPATVSGTPTTVGVTTFTFKSGSTNPLATFIWMVTDADPCAEATLSRSTLSSSAAARSDSVAISTASNCTWTGTAPEWIALSPASGQGNGTISYIIAANDTGQARTGTITIGGKSLSVSQAAGVCTGTVSPTTIDADTSGTSGTVQGTVLWGCALPAVADAPWWVHVSSGGYAAKVMQDTPTAYWRLGEVSGETAIDRSDAGVHLTYGGDIVQGIAASLADGNSAVTFQGGFASVPYDPAFDPVGESFSVEAWVRITAPTTGVVAGSYARYEGLPYGYALRLTGGHAEFRADYETQLFAVTSSRFLTDGRWHHIVGTLDAASGQARLFIDGVLDGTAAGAAPYGSGFAIGASTDGSSDIVSASIDEVAFYRQALTLAQVQAHFVEQHGPLVSDGFINWPIDYTIDANPFGFARYGGITIADHTTGIVQAASTCNVSVAPTGASIPAAQASGMFIVTATPGCAWSPSTSTPWLTVTGSLDGYPGQVVADGPAAYWRLNETTGTIAVDATGHGNTGEYSGDYVTGLVQGVSGALASDAATSFLNGNSYILTGDMPAMNTADGRASLEAWILYGGENSGTIVSQGNYQLQLEGDHVRLRAAGGEGDRFAVTGTRRLNNNAWHHIVGVIDPVNQVARLYVDGSLDGSTTFPVTFTHAGRAFIGPGAIAKIDEVAIYPYALTESQVLMHSVQRQSPGGGSGRFSFTAAANPTIDARNGQISVGEHIVSVVQGGVPCIGVSSSPAVNLTHTGGTGTIEVTAVNGGCPWTASVGETWVTLNPTSGTGAGQVGYAVGANTAVWTRTAVVTIAGVTVMITQRGVAPERPALRYSGALGGQHTLALRNDGKVWSWGSNASRQLGYSGGDRSVPIEVQFPTDIVAVAAGETHSVALKSDGTVWAWGAAHLGQLGDGDTTFHSSPAQTSNLTDVVAIAAGANHSLALKSDGTVWGWGRNHVGQLGDGTAVNRTTPVLIGGVPVAVAVSAAGDRSLVLDTTGSLWEFGMLAVPQAGPPAAGTRTPTPSALSATATFAAAARYGAFAIGSDASVWAWGLNDRGQFGDGTSTSTDTPQHLTAIADVAYITSSGFHTLALTIDGALWAWGNNSSGQLGDGTPPCPTEDPECATQPQAMLPIRVTGPTGIAALSANSNTSLAVTSTGEVWTWGNNHDRQLGDGSVTDQPVPTKIADADFLWHTVRPGISPASGTYLSAFTATATSATPGAVIRYTTDGNEPSEVDPVFPAGGLGVTQSIGLKLKAWAAGRPPSGTRVVTYALKVPRPTITPGTGVYTSAQQVTLTVSKAGATILYSTDGSTPVSGSPSTFVYSSPFTVSSRTQVFAVAQFPGWTTSDLRQGLIEFNYGTLDAPTLPTSGLQIYGTSIAMSAVPYAQIRYTIDGSIPTDTSPVYEGPLTLTAALTVTAVAFHPDWTTSQPAAATYSPKVATPTFSPDGGAVETGQLITVSVATPGATIHYTNNGLDPDTYDPIVANGGTVAVGNVTLKARAFRDGVLNSDVKSAEYLRVGDPCRFTISPLLVDVGPSPTGGVLTVAANESQCAWTASADAPWLGISPLSGSGLAGRVVYNIESNSTASQRTAVITIGGTNVVVRQAGLAPCSYAVTPLAIAASAEQTSGQIAIAAVSDTCAWTAVSNQPWLSISTADEISAYAQTIQADQSVGYWRLNDATGSTVAADASNGSHHGTVSGGVTFGESGALADASTSAGFNGTSAAVEIAHSDGFNAPTISWEAWINVPDVSNARRTIVGKGGSAGVFSLTIEPATSFLTVAFELVGGTRPTIAVPGTVVGAGWTHFAFTYDGSSWHTYINGVDVQSASIPGAAAAATSAIILGRDGALQEGWYDGRLADVALYGYALSAAQVAHHYALRNTTASGSNTELTYAIDANATGAVRSASLTIAGVTVPVSQAASTGVAISGSAAPSPNEAGWNNSNVTVTFTCAGAGQITCPEPVLVSLDGEDDVEGQASNDAGATASTSVHVKLDRTPPFLSVGSPMAGQLVEAGPITVTGTVGDLLSGLISATCNGQPATVADLGFTCSVTVPAGTSRITVVALDRASNVRTSAVDVTTSEVVITHPPTGLRISPQDVTMLAGTTRSFSVVDDRGRIPGDVVWTVDNSLVATVAQGPPMSLTGVSAGEVTLTASWLGLTATAQVRVLSAYGTTEVTTLWSVPPALGKTKRIVRGAARADAPGLIFTWESTGEKDSQDRIRAFNRDGTEAWSVNAGGRVVQLSGDPGGGAVALVEDRVSYTPQRLLIFGPNGGVAEGPSDTGGFALHPDGPLYYVSGGNLRSLDIGMGSGGTASIPGAPGAPTVIEEGVVVVPSVTGPHTFALTFLRPNGSVVTQSVILPESPTELHRAYRAIPNGIGGLLVQLMTRIQTVETYYNALVVGVDADGNHSGSTPLGKDWGDIVIGEGSAMATSYVWYAESSGRRRQHLGIAQLLNLDGTAANIPAIYPPNGPCGWWWDGSGWWWGGECGQPIIDITSVSALQGGGFITTLSNGSVSGAEPSLNELPLSLLQPAGGGEYLAAGIEGGLKSLALPLTTATTTTSAGWSTGGGGWLWSFAVGNYLTNLTQIKVRPLEGKTPDDVFNNFLTTFVGINNGTVATVALNGNQNFQVTGVGQELTFTMNGIMGVLQRPFSVKSVRFDPPTHTLVAETVQGIFPYGHPLQGWRYWRVFSLGPDLVIETGAMDKPAPEIHPIVGMIRTGGFLADKLVLQQQLQIWKEELAYIQANLPSTFLYNDPDLVNGKWGVDKRYIMNNICGPLPSTVWRVCNW